MQEGLDLALVLLLTGADGVLTPLNSLSHDPHAHPVTKSFTSLAPSHSGISFHTPIYLVCVRWAHSLCIAMRAVHSRGDMMLLSSVLWNYIVVISLFFVTKGMFAVAVGTSAVGTCWLLLWMHLITNFFPMEKRRTLFV